MAQKLGGNGGVSFQEAEALRKERRHAHTSSLRQCHHPVAPLSADARLHFLNIEHSDLDSAIAALALSGNADDLTVTRLKKRKLQIKDEIAALRSAAIGDGVAKAS